MKKLIELLNEYDEGGNWNEYRWIGLGCEDHNTIGYKDKNLSCEQDEIAAYLISKSYGFIKWLVDNDKIDFEKIKEKTKCKNIVGGEEFLDFDIERDFTPYEEVLMWLTIQDEPIEFLISILK